MKPLPELLPGDCLHYRPHDLFGYITAIKTWCWTVHVEIYRGDGMSVASRNGLGVDIYPTRLNGLCAITRPKFEPLDLAAADKWFEDTAKGQKYDWLALLAFWITAIHGSRKRMFCSEFAVRWYRKAGHHAVNPRWDADHTAPAQLLQSATSDWIWTAWD